MAFSIAALGMIGIPPVAGFVSKWYLGMGSLQSGDAVWVIPVLITSSLLNAAYFLPILYNAWFKPLSDKLLPLAETADRHEISAALLWPPLITATLALLIGLFAAAPYSPLEWASLIASREYK